MKIRFKHNHRPKGDAADIPTYKAGETYTFDGAVSEGYARKYIRLGLALEAVDEPAFKEQLADAGALSVEQIVALEDVPAEVIAEEPAAPPVVDFRRPGKYRK